ncbi:MAG: restriction endonuclease subunit S [Azovibrio sp.]|uniref:restriction endonuclease subunit S n=1 Tax=Azovibrio sp. TaxID=1872673 RepID=UPI003C70D952
MSEQIPASGLESFALSDIAHVEMGQSPDSRYVVEDPFQGHAFLQGNAEFGAVYPEPKFGCLRPAKVCKANDVLISVRAPVGAINLADRDYCIGRGLAAIRCQGIKPSLLGEVIARQSLALRRVAQGTTFEAINKNELLSLILNLPPRTDWPKIAEILDTLDTAIHETEAIIAKLKAVKQGLLHDLLTRGIDANGQLRPPQAEAPHLYKPSPLGWIPKEWDVKQFADLLADVDPAMRSGPFGSALLKQELVETGVPLLGIDNVRTERFVADYTRFVTPRKFAQLARYAVSPNDLMITIMGTVGRCCLVPDDVGQALSSKHTWTISLDQDAYSPYLAMLQVNYSPWVVGHFAKDQQGGTMAAIRSETLRSVRLPAPPREEQRLMEERLHELSKRIDLEVDSLAKQLAEKAGLMDDLLTGRVRVTPLLQEPQPA